MLSQLLVFAVRLEIFIVCVGTKNAFLKAIRQLSEKHHLTRLDLYHDDEGNPTQVDGINVCFVYFTFNPFVF